MKKYILHFDTFDNDTYFYDTLEELFLDWSCRNLKEFKETFKKDKYCILEVKRYIKKL